MVNLNIDIPANPHKIILIWGLFLIILTLPSLVFNLHLSLIVLEVSIGLIMAGVGFFKLFDEHDRFNDIEFKIRNKELAIKEEELRILKSKR